ncbi:MAG: hypothetical protein ILO68_01275 [Clostridia bacterium]|nr:hypothetical protein [Clostridia bacterium]
MTLDEQDLRSGLKFIVGTWQPDFLVNMFSDDLAHIPASEFKSPDGQDFTALTFRFLEDHTVALTAAEKEVSGTWEQTDLLTYRIHMEAFEGIPEGMFKDNAETLSVQDGHLVFGIGFLAVALQKTEEGTVTEEPDIGDLPQTEDDLAHKDIAGFYDIYKSFSMVGDDLGLHTREEIEEELDRKIAAGEAEEDEKAEYMRIFEARYEFTEDGFILSWMKLPEGVSQEEIDAAVEAGEIEAVKDGFFLESRKAWKYVNGGYYYDTGEERELFGEKQSSWDELKIEEDGCIPFGSGMMVLKKRP